MPMITDINQLDFSKEYTYADYLTWQFKERVELIKGRIFKMSPAPNRRHQTISRELFLEIGLFLRKKNCQVFHAPFDVRLPLPKDKATGDKITTVVQPDITVVCDENKLDQQGCNGAPDIVLEILSPGNSTREMKDKYQLYQSAGISEYWLVDPEHEFVIIYTLNTEGKYIGSEPYTSEATIKSSVLKGFELNVAEIF
jgi:Uma2 family endonuclease